MSEQETGTQKSPTDWHFHVYFDQQTRETAEHVVEKVANRFDIAVGHFHDNPVGPHPWGSCQLTIPVDLFGPVLSWMTLNRNGLTLFCHASTGDVMKDHTDHTIWLGSMPDLNLDVLRKIVERGIG